MKIITAKRTTLPSSRVVDLDKYKDADLSEVISQIIKVNKHLSDFWGNGAVGWAPDEVSDLLSKARMDRMISFSYRLNDILRTVDDEEAEAQLITSWATLGALIEGALALFFTVWRNDYVSNGPRKDKKDKAIEPHKLTFDQLKSLMLEHELIDRDSHDWINKLQQYRNVIHFFRDKEIGSKEDLHNSVKHYLALLEFIDDCLPYPDEMYRRY